MRIGLIKTMKLGKKKHVKWIVLLLLAVGILGSTIVMDLLRISAYTTCPRNPKDKLPTRQDQIYHDLVHGKQEIDWQRLDGTLAFIRNQYDCADFRLVNLIRILYEFEAQIPAETRSKIEHTLFGFRYWWDEPGENSMCYWSENHQILFASAEYLVGQKYPDTVFTNSALTGREHMAKARKRALDWLEMRWNYGFTEFYSNVYYKEDIGALINLIDLADDQELRIKSQIIMDLLFYDVATQTLNTQFVSVSGRAYEGNRKGGGGATLGGLTQYYWGNGNPIGPSLMYGMMTTQRYTLPPVLIDMARDTAPRVIKQCNGLDIRELKAEGYYGTDDRSMMMQLGMEAFTNPEIVRNSLAFMRKHRMFSNDFIGGFKIIDFTLLHWLHLEPTLVRLLNPQSNGVAIQKGNTYTYKTRDYSLYSVQNYHPGTFGDQHHVAGMNIGNSFCVFHTHPALEKDVPKQSPNYWVGYGHLPHVAQEKHISLAIYNTPDKKGFMEETLLDYTHAYFPQEKFDRVHVTENYAFGAKENTYCALIGQNPLTFRDGTTDNLIQRGTQSFWITEAGSQDTDHSFDAFCQRILSTPYSFDPETLMLTYLSAGHSYQLQFGGTFSVDNRPMNTDYDRFDLPYAKARRKDKVIKIECNGQSLHLDFFNCTRDF